jgi:hemoglobin-like flavoprotein
MLLLMAQLPQIVYDPAPPPSFHTPAPEGLSLTTHQKRLLRETFARLEPASDLVAALFYLRLFDLDPSLRALFKGPLKVQGRKLMTAIKLAVISLDHPRDLKLTLKLLGVRHRHYGVQADHYVTFSRAVMWTFEQSLEERFTRDAKQAWATLLAEMTRVMADTD